MDFNYNDFNNKQKNITDNINNQDTNFINNNNTNYFLNSSNENNKRKLSKILFAVFYLLVLMVGVMVFYYYRIDKNEFYFKNKEIVLGNGSSYLIELIPKDSRYFDHKNYVYKIENSNIATVDENGVITALNNGITDLNVRYKNSFLGKNIKIRVDDVKVTSVKTEDNIIINETQSTTINPLLNNQDNVNVDLEYKSNDPEIVEVDDFGNVTAFETGETTITILQNDEIVGEIPVTVETNPISVDSIAFSETNISMTKDSKHKLIPIITPSNAYSLLSFESSNEVVSVSKNGEVIANNVGSSVVTVKDINGKTASVNINVTENIINVEKINLNISNKEMNEGEVYQLVSTLVPSNSTLRTIKWKSSDNNIATVTDGKVRAIKEGNVTITATTVNGKNAQATIKVKKNKVEATSVSLNITKTTLYVGDELNLIAKVTPSNASNILTWSSSNKNVVSVDDGKIKALNPGTSTITVKTNNGKIATSIILVQQKIIPVVSVDLNTYSQNLKVNETYQLKAIVNPSDANNKIVKWTSSNKSIATVDQNGLVKAIAVGSATIKAEADGKSQVVEINVIKVQSKKPTGKCTATLYNGSTTVTVSTSDTDIKTYNYNGVNKNKSTYTVAKYLREAYVYLTNTSGVKSNKIKCTVALKTLPVNKPTGTLKYKAESSSLKVYVKEKSGFYLAYIWAKDPVYQLRKQMISGSKFQKPSDILQSAVNSKYSKKIMLGFNASGSVGGAYYKPIYNKNSAYIGKEPSPLLIYNGDTIINDSKVLAANYGYTYYLDGSNNLKYYSNASLKSKTVNERKEFFANIKNSGVYNTFSFTPMLVSNGKVNENAYVNGAEYNAYRQGICQVNNNNFIVVSSKSGKTKSTKAFGELLKSLGCKTAFNLDGGGSHAMLYKPSNTSSVKVLTGNERSLSTVMYFTELN